MIAEILASRLSQDEQNFLIAAAYRHNVFQYSKIADYYAHSPKNVQALMEKSALVIIDFGQAIENGYVKFVEDIKALYLDEYEKQN